MPNLFIIAGPNGAGKTTYVKRFLPEEMRCREFVNADLIAAGLSPYAPDTVAFEAGRIMLRRLRELFERREDFSFETTLTGFGYTHLLREMREAGYRVRLDYLWIPDLEITRARVKQRVRKGGHNIPDEVQQRRFRKGLSMLFEHYRPLVHYWRIFDNTGQEPKLVVEEQDDVLSVKDLSKLAEIEAASSLRVMGKKPEGRVEESAAFALGEDSRAGLRAMRKAFADVVLENKAWGLPIIQWREGKGMVEVPAEQLEPLARRILEVNGEPLPEDEERALLAHVKI
ncbi:MAG TPA: zeta toxin family protein [Opitutaceae bacterium]|nr:zeta toxin family protein [Opitutaceae bacterium]